MRGGTTGARARTCGTGVVGSYTGVRRQGSSLSSNYFPRDFKNILAHTWRRGKKKNKGGGGECLPLTLPSISFCHSLFSSNVSSASFSPCISSHSYIELYDMISNKNKIIICSISQEVVEVNDNVYNRLSNNDNSLL